MRNSVGVGTRGFRISPVAGRRHCAGTKRGVLASLLLRELLRRPKKNATFILVYILYIPASEFFFYLKKNHLYEPLICLKFLIFGTYLVHNGKFDNFEEMDVLKNVQLLTEICEIPFFANFGSSKNVKYTCKQMFILVS